MTATFAPWASLGVSGVISGLLVWIITVGIPAMRKSEKEALSALVEGFRQEREADRKARHETNTSYNQSLSMMYDANRDEIGKLTEAVTALRIANEKICRFQTPSG